MEITAAGISALSVQVKSSRKHNLSLFYLNHLFLITDILNVQNYGRDRIGQQHLAMTTVQGDRYVFSSVI